MSNKKQTPQQAAGVMYQIYPRSFADADGDGTGDLRGVLQKIDYLAELGVDSIWLSPIYASPMADFGYDISDYRAIDPVFGSLEDFDRLVAAAHDRNIKIVMDYVGNHTSDRHAWFQDSAGGKDAMMRDWYVWADPGEDGGPPNNWLSLFGGPAWEFDERSGQYYLHTFLKEQPDLNWRNEHVVKAMLDVLRFWIERGVDGFRTDAFAHMFKDEQFRDEPINPHYRHGDWLWTQLEHIYTQHHPDLKLLYGYFDEVFEEYPNRDLFMVTEDYAGMDDIKWHYRHSNNARFAPLNLGFIELEWNFDTLHRYVDTYENALSGEQWPNYGLGNHDQTRVASRAGLNATRVAAMMLLTLRGTPIIYYGEEIGMQDVKIPVDRIRDPVSLRDPNTNGRDPQRTPMQWSPDDNAGFSKTEPWLPLSDNYQVLNVAVQETDNGSLLNLYKRLISVRKQSQALTVGSYAGMTDNHNRYVMAYWREHEDEKLLIALNLDERTQEIQVPGSFEVILATDPLFTMQQVDATLSLSGSSGIILRPIDS